MNFKSYIAGLVTGLALVSVPIFADGYTRALDALVNYTTVQVDGQTVESDNFVVDGKTYVWIRDVASMLGKEVLWDDDTQTADIVSVFGNVGERKITSADLVSLINSTGAADKNALKTSAAEYLADQYTIESYANSLNIFKDDAIRSRALESLAALKEAYGEEVWADYLASNGITEEDYVDTLGDSIFIQTVSEALQEDFHPSDAELQEAYETLKDQLTTVTTKHILISTADGISDADAKKQAEDLYSQLTRGADFDKLMAEYSQDPGTKDNPEGFSFTRGQMVSAYEEAAFSQEVGKLYEPIQTEYGYHIVLVTDRSIMAFEDAYDTCYNYLFDNYTQALLDEHAGTLDIYIDYDALDAFRIQ